MAINSSMLIKVGLFKILNKQSLKDIWMEMKAQDLKENHIKLNHIPLLMFPVLLLY
jgi:hypothetical protein